MSRKMMRLTPRQLASWPDDLAVHAIRTEWAILLFNTIAIGLAIATCFVNNRRFNQYRNWSSSPYGNVQWPFSSSPSATVRVYNCIALVPPIVTSFTLVIDFLLLQYGMLKPLQALVQSIIFFCGWIAALTIACIAGIAADFVGWRINFTMTAFFGIVTLCYLAYIVIAAIGVARQFGRWRSRRTSGQSDAQFMAGATKDT